MSPPHNLWDAATNVARHLQSLGFEARFAGGCVRDHLLGLTPHDIDIATNASPDHVLRAFPHAKPVGKAFGVVIVPLPGGHAIEVATYRKESGYLDGRRPTHVEFTTAPLDASRRDFTINGMFLDPLTGQLFDYVHGQRDLQLKIVRAIGDPAQRFHEDALRMIRAVRFASVLHFTLHPDTLAAIQTHASRIQLVSIERIQHELTRILCETRHRAGHAIHLLHQTRLLPLILPEVAALQGVQQPPEFHPEGDVYTHTLLMLDRLSQPDPVLAYAVLLHDIGKPATATLGPDRRGGTRIRFDGHAELGARIAETILTRLKLPRALIDRVVHLVAHHMRFIDAPRMRKNTLRRIIGHPDFPLALELHRLDCLASHGSLDTYHFLQNARQAYQNEPVLPPRWITGRDLLNLGLPPGPHIGHLLNTAYDLQLEGRFPTPQALLNHLQSTLDG